MLKINNIYWIHCSSLYNVQRSSDKVIGRSVCAWCITARQRELCVCLGWREKLRNFRTNNIEKREDKRQLSMQQNAEPRHMFARNSIFAIHSLLCWHRGSAWIIVRTSWDCNGMLMLTCRRKINIMCVGNPWAAKKNKRLQMYQIQDPVLNHAHIHFAQHTRNLIAINLRHLLRLSIAMNSDVRVTNARNSSIIFHWRTQPKGNRCWRLRACKA